MFNKILFNKTPFNKRLSSGLEALSFYGGGIENSINITIYTELIFSPPVIFESDFNLASVLQVPLEFNFLPYTQDDLFNCIITTLKILDTIEIHNETILEISSIGTVALSILRLDGISLAPWQSIEIDTDAMTVLFKETNTYDVSSVTKNSSFFELGPEGENEMRFVAQYRPKKVGQMLLIPENGAKDLKVTTIWAERWL